MNKRKFDEKYTAEMAAIFWETVTYRQVKGALRQGMRETEALELLHQKRLDKAEFLFESKLLGEKFDAFLKKSVKAFSLKKAVSRASEELRNENLHYESRRQSPAISREESWRV